MSFKHDPAKAAANLKKHGVSFSDAEGVLEDPLAVTVEDPDAEGEQRFITVGLGSAGELLVLVWTERNGEFRPIDHRRRVLKPRLIDAKRCTDKALPGVPVTVWMTSLVKRLNLIGQQADGNESCRGL